MWIFSRVKNLILLIQQRKKRLEVAQQKKIRKISKNKIDSSDFSQKISFSFLLKFWFAGTIVLYISYILFQSLNVIYLILTAFIISIAMESIISIFQRFVINRPLAIILSYVLLFTFLVMGFVLVVPFIIDQSAELIKILVNKFVAFQNLLQNKGLIQTIQTSSLPGYIKSFLIKLFNNSQFVNFLQESLQKNIAQIVSFGSSYVKNVGTIAVGIIGKFLSVIVQILFVFIIAIFFSLEKESVINTIAVIFGNPEYIRSKFEKLYKRLGNRLKGQLLLCFFIGTAVYIGLLTISFFGLDLPSKGVLALIAGIMEFIPILGPTLGAIPMALVALGQYGLIGFVVIVLFYIILQLAENNFLVPLIMGQAVGVNALLIFITMTLGGVIFGFIGVILGVPLAVILSLIFEDFFEDED